MDNVSDILLSGTESIMNSIYAGIYEYVSGGPPITSHPVAFMFSRATPEFLFLTVMYSRNVISPQSHGTSFEVCRPFLSSVNTYTCLISQLSQAIILSFVYHVFLLSLVRLHLSACFGRQKCSIFLYTHVRLRGLYHQLVSSCPCSVIFKGL